MNKLTIETTENGFIVFENPTIEPYVPNVPTPTSKRWSFESADSLAKFIGNWGYSNTKVVPEGVSHG